MGRRKKSNEVYTYLVPFELKKVKRNHTNYGDQMDDLKGVFDVLKDPKKPKGVIPVMHEMTKIPLSTLKTWKHNVEVDPEWLPDHSRPKFTILKPEAVSEINDELHVQYINQHEYLPTSQVQSFIRDYAQEHPEQLNCPVEDFKVSNHFVYDYLDENDLSIRRWHPQRRTLPNDEIVSSFITDYQVAKVQYPPELIINADETSWHLLQTGLTTVTDKGTDGVYCQFPNAGPKECLTVMAAITRNGNKLPLMVICKGKTDRCQQKITESPILKRYIDQEKLLVTCSESGWTTEDVSLQYLEWMKHGYAHGNSMALLWDVYSAHRTENVKQFAARNDIGMMFIPAGQTGEWQPLDFRIFGSLKARAKAEFDKRHAVHRNGDEYEINWELAIDILIQCWDEISTEEAINAWSKLDDDVDLYDVPDNAEEEAAEEADPEFEEN